MRVEISPSGRAGCRGCKKPIAKGELRFAESYVMPGSDQDAYRYWHLGCAALKVGESLKPAMAAYEGDFPDRSEIEEAIRTAPKKTGKDRPLPHADRAPTSRAKCMHCSDALSKGDFRVGVEREVDTGAFVTRGPGYLHPGCFRAWSRDRPEAEDSEWMSKMLANSDLSAAESADLMAKMSGD